MSPNNLNKMCLTCKCLGESCKGTTNQAWTGCIYYKSKGDKYEFKQRTNRSS